MKKVLLIMAVALLMMTQCRKPETPSADTIKMTVTVGPGAKTDITDNGAITWSKDDVLYVSNGTSWLGSLTLNEEDAGSPSGTFTGEISAIGDGTKCHFFYLGQDNVMEELTGTNNAVISFATQDGTREGALKYHLGYGEAVVTVNGNVATGAVRMKTKIAMAHLKLKMNDAAYTGSVTMDVSNTMTVSPDGTFSGSGNGIAIGNNGGTSGDRYVTLIPTEATNVSFSGSATGSMTFGHGIQANNLYGMANGIVVTLTAAHEYVDLGLPSGLLWATCNLGAEHPYDYGDYYQWGGVTPVTSTSINVGWAGCPFTNGTYSSGNKKVFTKYVPQSKASTYGYQGFWDGKTVLDAEDDAAHVNWGSDWRMPTTGDWKELYDNTDCTWTTENGVAGRKFTSKTDSSKYIFLPAAGYRNGTSLYNAGSDGYYWSSSLNSSRPDNAYDMRFNSGTVRPQGYNTRYSGLAVRPVRAAR